MMIWVIIFGMAIVTFGIRLSFIELFGHQSLHPMVQRALQFVPIAVLTAIIIPDLFVLNGAYALSFANGRLIAASVAALVAWRTKNTILTICVGMAVLFAVQM